MPTHAPATSATTPSAIARAILVSTKAAAFVEQPTIRYLHANIDHIADVVVRGQHNAVFEVKTHTSSLLKSDAELIARHREVSNMFPAVMVQSESGMRPCAVTPFIITSLGRVHDETKKSVVSRFGAKTAGLIIRAASVACARKTAEYAAQFTGVASRELPSPQGHFEMIGSILTPIIAAVVESTMEAEEEDPVDLDVGQEANDIEI